MLSQKEALGLAFPGCKVERATLYLTAAQQKRASVLAGEPARSALVPVYRARRGDELAGTAYFDVHRVRTLQETIMVVVDPKGRVSRVEVLAFDEPPDYLPRRPWYQQFEGRALDPELRLDRAIRPVTGASLTARATTAAVRRVLAVHQAVAESAPPQAEPAATPHPTPPRAQSALPPPTRPPPLGLFPPLSPRPHAPLSFKERAGGAPTLPRTSHQDERGAP